MTLYFDLKGVDFAVMGEKIPGYRPVLDHFEIKKVWVRGPAQNIAGLLKENILKRLAAEALAHAQHPVPLPYDVPTPRMEGGEELLAGPLSPTLVKHYCACGRELITREQIKTGICEICATVSRNTLKRLRPENSPTLAEVNARRGFEREGGVS